uniref:Uncharacterized protein n=1 Tax=Anguilla anguilla TaxID=7936 RepID=A0A0E9WSL0_ANGAN
MKQSPVHQVNKFSSNWWHPQSHIQYIHRAAYAYRLFQFVYMKTCTAIFCSIRFLHNISKSTREGMKTRVLRSKKSKQGRSELHSVSLLGSVVDVR